MEKGILAYTGLHQKQLIDSRTKTISYTGCYGRRRTKPELIEVDRWYMMKCVDCETSYPILGNVIKCNGQVITKCPYCK